MLRAKLAAFAGALILAGTAFANQEACPKLGAIQAEGVSMAMPIFSSLYGAYQLSTYNTDSYWGFVIAPIDAESENDAVEYANDILSDMTAPGVAEEVDGSLMCTYDTGHSDIYAIAVNTMFVSPMQLKQLIHRAH